jgi:hypothetical protein
VKNLETKKAAVFLYVRGQVYNSRRIHFLFGKYAKFDSPEFARLLKSVWGGVEGFFNFLKQNKNNYEQAIRNGSHENCIC